jgi:UPF0755 protein
MDEKQLPDESTGQMPPLEIDEVQNLPTEQEASTPSPESSDAPVEESLLDEDDLLWLENLISNPESTNEIQADESAIAAAGLTHPNDLELERIIQEAKSEDWGLEEAQMESHLSEDEDFTFFLGDQDTFKDDEFRDTFGNDGEALDQVFNDPSLPPAEEDSPAEELPAEAPEAPEADEEPAPEEPLEKVRPRRKVVYGLFGLPHLLVTVIWVAIIALIGITIGRMVWLCASDVLALGQDPIVATITIEADDDMDDIADKLKDAGLIRYPGLFKIYAKLTDAHEKIKPGTYYVNQNAAGVPSDQPIVYDYMSLVSVLTPSKPKQNVVSGLRIPEGYTCAQIFQLLEDKGVCTVAELEAYVASIDPNNPDTALNYWFLEGVQWGDRYSLEGYLFPNTYDFYENDKPERVLGKMLSAFNANFTDRMKELLDKLNDRMVKEMMDKGYSRAEAEKRKYTIREVVIIASLIEKESANNLESFRISSVIYNRLTNPNVYPKLEIDATVIYALGGKTDLTAEDLRIDHPFNTYMYEGLPPGAICSPSQNSLAAALNPEVTEVDYYFYVLNPFTGKHYFSETRRQHEAAIEAIKNGKNPEKEEDE